MVIRPIELLPSLVNHNAPSGPAVIPGLADAGAGVVGHPPAVVIRPIELLPWLVNHSAPSGPAVIPAGFLMLGPVYLDLTSPGW